MNTENEGMMASLQLFSKIGKTERLLIETLENRWLLAADWQNPIDPVNVDGVDGDGATPLDALQVINELTVPTVRDHETFRLPDLGPEEGSPPPFFDVDGDQIVSPLDALLVINALTENSGPTDAGSPVRAPDSVVAGSRAAADHEVGHDTLVNTTTSRAQTFPDVDGFSDGSFITVWNSAGQDGSGKGVFAQMYDASGAKQGDEFQVNSTTHKSQSRPAVAANSSGQYAVVWQSLGQDGSGWGVYGQIFDSQGMVGSEFLVNQTTSGNQFLPDAAFLSDGTLVVTWEGRGASDRTGIYSRMFDGSGNATSEETLVNTFERGAQNRPSIAADTNGGYLIAWDGRGDGDNAGVFVRHFGTSGASDVLRVGDSPSRRQTMANVTAGPTGEFAVSWQERPEETGGWGARAQILSSSLTEVGSEILANQTTRGLQAGTTAAILDDGSLVIGWHGRGDGDRLGVFTRMYDSSGSPTSDEMLTNSTTRARQSRPAMASLGSSYVTLWDGFGDADNVGVYSRIMGDPSETNTDPMLVQPIPDQIATADSSFTLDVTSFFADADANDVLSYSATIDGGALPAWLGFNSASGIFSGTPASTDVGSQTITVRATDLAGASVSDTFMLTVLDAGTQFTLSGTIFADANGSGTQDGGETGIAGTTVTLQGSGSTVATTTTAGDGTYSFTVAAGTYNVVVSPPAGVQTADPDGTLDNQTTVALSADRSSVDFGYNQAPTASAIADATVPVGSAFNLDVSSAFSDPEGSALTLMATGLPGWLSFTPATGTFSGTPAAGDVGASTVTVSATDPGNLSASTSFQVTVQSNGQNQSPVFSGPIPNETVQSGTALNKSIVSFFSDPDNDTLTYMATQVGGAALPAWIGFNGTTGLFSGTPADTDAGTISVQVTASDGMANASGAFDLTVTTSSNQPPIVANEIMDQTVVVGGNLSLNITSNFSDPDGDSLTFSAAQAGGGALPAWMMFNAATGQFSGSPSAGDVGMTSVTVTATDGQGSVSDTFVVTVEMQAANQAPQVQNPIADQTTSINRLFSLDATNVFSDPDGDTLTLSVTSALPGWLDFTDGMFSGTPGANDLGQMTQVTVVATDPGGLTATEMFNIEVVANQNPIANDIQDMTVVAFVPYTFSAAFFFSDPDAGDMLTFTSNMLPNWLTFQDGVFSGTPGAADTGTFNVTVTATDELGASASDSFNVTVNTNMPPNQPGTIADHEALVDLNFFLRTDTVFSDPDPGDQLSYSAMLAGGGALPSWLEINESSGLLSGTPATSDIGQISVVVTATDLAGQQVSASPFQITVTDQGTAVEVTLMTLDMSDNPITTIGPGQSFQLVASVQDVRTAPTGVFSAYMDVTYTAGAVTPAGPIQHSTTYGAGASGDTSTPGIIDEVGGTDGTSQLGGAVFEVFRIEMMAGQTPGTVNFATDMAEDLVQHPLLVFSEMGATPPQYVDFGTTTIDIVAPAIQAPAGADSTLAGAGETVPLPQDVPTAVNQPNEVDPAVLSDFAIRNWRADGGATALREVEQESGFAVQLLVDELIG